MNNDTFSNESDVVDAELVESTDTTAEQPSHSSSKADSDGEKCSTLKTNILSAEHWLRFVFMALFVVIAFTASYIAFVLIIIQFIFALITGGSDPRLQSFAYSLSQYILQMLNFLTYNSEEKPFPFADWPQQDESAADATSQQV